MKIEFFIAYASTASVIVPLVPAIYQARYLKTYSKLILILLICSLLTDVLSYFLSREGITTNWIVNAYLLVQFSLLWMIYFKELSKPRPFVLIATVFITYFFGSFFFNDFFNFNTHANSIAGLILVGIAIYHLYHLLNELPAANITNVPMFWVTFAVLCYYGGTLVLFLMNNLMLGKYLASHRMLWILHNICNILKNILLAIALWQSYRNLKPSL
jgi:hypothetical protein